MEQCDYLVACEFGIVVFCVEVHNMQIQTCGLNWPPKYNVTSFSALHKITMHKIAHQTEKKGTGCFCGML